ncbi:MAG: AraC family ligand binding domain-containing protein [Symbiopectobacterium sp.]
MGQCTASSKNIGFLRAYLKLNAIRPGVAVSVRCSSQCYKTYTHTQLSLGLVEVGSTVCHYRGAGHLLRAGELRAGDMILIDPHVPHSCTPLLGQTRSYHMFSLDSAWCRTLLA